MSEKEESDLNDAIMREIELTSKSFEYHAPEQPYTKYNVVHAYTAGMYAGVRIAMENARQSIEKYNEKKENRN